MAAVGHSVVEVRRQDGRGVYVQRDVLVIDAEQAVLGRARAFRQRHEADEVAIVSERLELLLGGRICMVEGRRIGEQRIAPLEQHVDLVAGRHMLGLVGDPLELGEGEGRAAGGRGGRVADRGRAQQARDPDARGAGKGGAAREPGGDHVAVVAIGGSVQDLHERASSCISGGRLGATSDESVAKARAELRTATPAPDRRSDRPGARCRRRS